MIEQKTSAQRLLEYRAKEREVAAALAELNRITGTTTEEDARKISTPSDNRWSRILGFGPFPDTGQHWARTGPKAGHEAAVARAVLDAKQKELSKLGGLPLSRFTNAKEYGTYISAVGGIVKATADAAAAKLVDGTKSNAAGTEFNQNASTPAVAAPSAETLRIMATTDITGASGSSLWRMFAAAKQGDIAGEPTMDVGEGGAHWFAGFGKPTNAGGSYVGGGSVFYPITKRVASMSDALEWVNSLSYSQRSQLANNLFSAGLLDAGSSYDFAKPYAAQRPVLPTDLASGIMSLMLETLTDPGKTMEDKAKERVQAVAPYLQAQAVKQKATELTNTKLLMSIAQRQAQETLHRDLSPAQAQSFAARINAQEGAQHSPMGQSEIAAELEDQLKSENATEIHDRRMATVSMQVADFLKGGG